MANAGNRHWLSPPEWWKKWRPLRWLAILTILGGMASGLWSGARLVMEPEPHAQTEAYLHVPALRIKLIGSFDSYAKVSDATATLAAAGYTWVHRKNHRMPDPEFPPRDLDTVTVEKYKHQGSAGMLILKFFNNRLYEAEFKPEDAAGYASALRRAEPRLKRDRIGKIEYVDGAARVASNVDLASSEIGKGLRTTPYAIWQDLRLIRQRNQWDADYASIPYKAKF